MRPILFAISAAWLTASPAAACYVYDNLAILSTDTDPDIHEVVTHDIWAVWYHPEAYSDKEALRVARRLARVRCEASENLAMLDPKAAYDGFYTNVILHVPDDETLDNGIPNDWGDAVGFNDEGYSQMELGPGAPYNLYVLDHEGWHVMQDQISNRYENVEAYSFWIAEASADWFAWNQEPNLYSAFDTAASIVASPQLPFWAENQNLPQDMEPNDLIGTRPYAFNTLLAYLELHTPITQQDITRGYFTGNQTPQEIFIEKLGFDGFADAYADFNAKLTAMMIEGDWGNNLDDFIFTEPQRTEAVDGLDNYYDPDEDTDFLDTIHPIAAEVDAEDLEPTWTEPYGDARPFAWGYNVVSIDYPDGTPTLEFEGKDMRLRLVTLEDEEWHIEPVQNGDTLNLIPVESAYLVITSTPQTLGGYERQSYRLRLQ